MFNFTRPGVRALIGACFAIIGTAAAQAQQSGIASQYSQLGTTASGRSYSSGDMVAAHRSLPFGTRVRVDNLSNGRSTVVRIVDRGPFIGGRIIDLSTGAARQIGFSGLANVRVSVIGRDDGGTSYASSGGSRRSVRVASNEDENRPARRASARSRVASYDADERPAGRSSGQVRLASYQGDDAPPARRSASRRTESRERNFFDDACSQGS